MDEKKKSSPLKKGLDYLHEVWLEVRRASWPDRRTLVAHTIVVIVGVLLLGLYVGISDRILGSFIRLLVPRG